MEKWIIEADLYRLHKQLREGAPAEQRPQLLRLLEHKERLLARSDAQVREH